MNNNSNYWTDKSLRSQAAMSHHDEMERKYCKEIYDCSMNTRCYSNYDMISFLNKDKFKEGAKPYVELSGSDTVSAAFLYGEGRTAILNFASYKEPGGMFLAGSKAQEECLCHESILYEVLERHQDYYDWNKQHLSRALYQNRALYSSDVVFEHKGEKNTFDVITCAAPNASAFLHYNEDNGEVAQAIESRIMFLKYIVETAQEPIDTLIFGAFGCGVFGCDATLVAQMFKKYFETSTVKKIVYAVLNPESPNYKAFYKVLGADIRNVKF